MNPRMTTLAALLAGGLAVSGCVSNEPKRSDSQAQAAPASASQAAAEPVPQAAPAPAPKATAAAPAAKVGCENGAAKAKTKTAKNTAKKGKTSEKATEDPACAEPAAQAARAQEPVQATSGGYDLSKNKPVTDSTKVESGQGTMVKGIDDWQGEITGIPAANSKFTKLKIGMPLKQVTDLVGEPTDQGAYVTAKAFIPFYFGSDRSRWEAVYKGQGRLIFSNQSGLGTGQYLTWIIHNANEQGYR